MKHFKHFVSTSVSLVFVTIAMFGCQPQNSSLSSVADADEWVVYDDYDGPGNGKHIVFVTEKWWAHLDSNQGPLRCEHSALTN